MERLVQAARHHGCRQHQPAAIAADSRVVVQPGAICSAECPVVVALGLLVWVEVWGWDEPGEAVPYLDGPFVLMDQMVVVAAQKYSVVGAGGSAV